MLHLYTLTVTLLMFVVRIVYTMDPYASYTPAWELTLSDDPATTVFVLTIAGVMAYACAQMMKR